MNWHDLGPNDWKIDSGYITDHDKLPIKEVLFSSPGFVPKLRVTVGPLFCQQEGKV